MNITDDPCGPVPPETQQAANKRVTAPVTAIPQDDLLDVLRAERESLFRRIEPKKAGLVELRLRLKDVTRLIMRLELIERGQVIL